MKPVCGSGAAVPRACAQHCPLLGGGRRKTDHNGWRGTEITTHRGARFGTAAAGGGLWYSLWVRAGAGRFVQRPHPASPPLPPRCCRNFAEFSIFPKALCTDLPRRITKSKDSKSGKTKSGKPKLIANMEKPNMEKPNTKYSPRSIKCLCHDIVHIRHNPATVP